MKGENSWDIRVLLQSWKEDATLHRSAFHRQVTMEAILADGGVASELSLLIAHLFVRLRNGAAEPSLRGARADGDENA